MSVPSEAQLDFFLSSFQGNNAYIFPGLGLGVLAAGSKRITDEDMLVAADALADCVSDEQLQTGCMYPAFSHIREVSKKIAVSVALRSHEVGVATNVKPGDMEAYIDSIMYDPFRRERSCSVSEKS